MLGLKKVFKLMSKFESVRFTILGKQPDHQVWEQRVEVH